MLGPGPYVWRGHAGPGAGPFEDFDAAAAPGDYRLQVACLGDAARIMVDGKDHGVVRCGVEPRSYQVCLTRRGMRVRATPQGRLDDLVWQLDRRSEVGSCG